MKIVKTRLHNKMDNDFLVDSIVHLVTNSKDIQCRQ